MTFKDIPSNDPARWAAELLNRDGIMAGEPLPEGGILGFPRYVTGYGGAARVGESGGPSVAEALKEVYRRFWQYMAREHLKTVEATDKHWATVRERAVRTIVSIENTQGQVVGSGICLGAYAFVTADHVADYFATNPDAGGPILVSHSGERRPGSVVLRHPVIDLARVTMHGEPMQGLFPATVQSDYPPAMSGAMVIGCPYGLRFYSTLGVTSDEIGKILYWKEPQEVGSTDAPANPGNSGGGVFDRDGNLIGVLVAGMSGADGLHFFVPAEKIGAVL